MNMLHAVFKLLNVFILGLWFGMLISAYGYTTPTGAGIYFPNVGGYHLQWSDYR